MGLTQSESDSLALTNCTPPGGALTTTALTRMPAQASSAEPVVCSRTFGGIALPSGWRILQPEDGGESLLELLAVLFVRVDGAAGFQRALIAGDVEVEVDDVLHSLPCSEPVSIHRFSRHLRWIQRILAAPAASLQRNAVREV